MATDFVKMARDLKESERRNYRIQRAYENAKGKPGLFIYKLYIKDIREHINPEGALLIHLHILAKLPRPEAFRTRKFLRLWGKTPRQFYRARGKLERAGVILTSKRTSNVIDISLVKAP